MYWLIYDSFLEILKKIEICERWQFINKTRKMHNRIYKFHVIVIKFATMLTIAHAQLST